MTDDTPPVLYISAYTSDLTTRYKATPRMHMGADAWVRQEEVEKLQARFADLLGAAHGLSYGEDWNDGTAAKTHGYRAKLLRAVAELMGPKMSSPQALAALPAPDEGAQEEGEAE